MSDADPVSVLIADDEPLARERLRRLIGSAPGFRLVAEAVDGPDAVRKLGEHHPEVAVLDIRLPGLDAFAILNELGDGPRPAVIFVTAHTDRAADAFQAGAVDYVLKPFDAKRLQTALHRATSGRNRTQIPRAALPPASDERVALRSGGRWILMDASAIELAHSANLHCEVVSREGATIRVNESLGSLESRLPADRFLRVSRFAIVNLGAIRTITPKSHGDQTLELASGRTVLASRSRRAEVLNRLKGLR
ncbi:MAG: response regulator transcription factor [Verrucomicrobia bacterium]|nr:response regulator transcription factor [Verrucomicrobiota bacterium]